MKRLIVIISALAMVLVISKTASAFSITAPTLSVTTSGIEVTLSWTPIANADGYRLYYAPYPDASYIRDIDMANQTSVSFDLWDGAAFYVAVKTYNTAGTSDYSNIEYFIIDSIASDMCLEVSTVTSFIGPSFVVELVSNTGEIVKSFGVQFRDACVSSLDGPIACYSDAIVSGGALVSFNATIDGVNYVYPRDKCD